MLITFIINCLTLIPCFGAIPTNSSFWLRRVMADFQAQHQENTQPRTLQDEIHLLNELLKQSVLNTEVLAGRVSQLELHVQKPTHPPPVQHGGQPAQLQDHDYAAVAADPIRSNSNTSDSNSMPYQATYPGPNSPRLEQQQRSVDVQGQFKMIQSRLKHSVPDIRPDLSLMKAVKASVERIKRY